MSKAPYAIVLGTAQDGGIPHAGCYKSCCERARQNQKLRRFPASLALIDPLTRQRFIIDCTPEFPRQLDLLNAHSDRSWGLSGVLLTHAHVGHYTGLIHLGREVMGTSALPVYAMPRMTEFLHHHEPWRQLVDLGHIELRELVADQTLSLTKSLSITAHLVPHRAEISETVGFKIDGSQHRAFYLPDIDDFDSWDRALETVIEQVDRAWIDGTFFDAKELIGRDLSTIPHPLISETLKRLEMSSEELRAKVHFIHLNHSNPVCQSDHPAYLRVQASGCQLAADGDRFEL